MRNFSLVVALLTVGGVVIGLLTYYINGTVSYGSNPAAAQKLEARIAPVGQVFTGEAGQAAAAAASSTPVKKIVTAFGGRTDGAEIFQAVCSACHGTGAAGAPRLEAAAWAARKAQGVDTLVAHAVNGFTGASGGMMPAKGGRADLSEAQIRATVEWMLANLK